MWALSTRGEPNKIMRYTNPKNTTVLLREQAMKAAAALATAAGDDSSTALFEAAASRGTASLDTLQWVNHTDWSEQQGAYCPSDYTYAAGAVRLPSGCRPITAQWRGTRFRLAPRTYAPCGMTHRTCGGPNEIKDHTHAARIIP